MHRRNLIALAALAASTIAAPLVQAQGKDIKIAIIASKTGPLEAYAKQTIVGFHMGLNYATGGTMTVAGRKLVVIEKDDQGKPDVGKAALAAAYADEKVDIAVGPTASPVALAMLPVAEEYKKILLVEPAVADSITGDKWNKYIFRTGRNSSQDAAANAGALDQPGNVIALLANDNAFGRDGVKAAKAFTKKAKIVHEEYLPVGTTDFTAGLQRIIDKLKDQPGNKYLSVAWSGAPAPFAKIADLELEKRYGIKLATGGNILPAMVAQHYKEFKAPPDFFTAGGFSAAMAIVTALNKTAGDTNTNKLIATMEGMSFDTPKGKMTFRKEDHQAMQSMYHFRIKSDPAFAWGVPELVREIKPEEMDIPITNKR